MDDKLLGKAVDAIEAMTLRWQRASEAERALLGDHRTAKIRALRAAIGVPREDQTPACDSVVHRDGYALLTRSKRLPNPIDDPLSFSSEPHWPLQRGHRSARVRVIVVYKP